MCQSELDSCNHSVGIKSQITLIFSLIILGSASGSVVVPILLELVQSVKDALGTKPGANEKGSALFTMGGALGSIMGNWVGGFLFASLGNPKTCDIFAIMALSMATIYFLANIYPAFLLKKKTPETEAQLLAKKSFGAPTTEPSGGQHALLSLNQEQEASREHSYIPATTGVSMAPPSHQPRRSTKRKTGQPLENIEDDNDASQSRIIKQIGYSNPLDLMMPVTVEDKKYLEHIDEEHNDYMEAQEQIEENVLAEDREESEA